MTAKRKPAGKRAPAKGKRGRKRRSSGLRWWHAILLLLFAGLLAVVVLVAMVHGGAFGKLPSRDELAAIRNEEATLVLARDGTIIGRLFAEDRTNIDRLRKLLYDRVKAIHVARYPYESDLLYGDEFLGG